MPPREVLALKAGTLWWYGWYWVARPAEGAELTVADMQAFYAAVDAHQTQPSPLLVDRSHGYAPSFEAMQLASREYPRRFSAVAYVVYSPLGRMASELFKTMFLNNVPVQIFYTHLDAEQWLAHYRQP